MLTFPIIMLVFAAFVEFGYAMSQWNQTVKALQYGARLAAVSDPLMKEDDFDAVFPIEAADPTQQRQGRAERCGDFRNLWTGYMPDCNVRH